ncbi:MAG: uncharacterized protein H6Q89_1779 [Myxococcaceae bacterium]|nr:uncharacterized protein [Myxococcaceae bacterium]
MTPAVLLAPVDSLRSALLRPWGTSLRPLLLSRARRVGWIGAFGVTVAFAIACGFPLWGLALGPVVLGVPHVLADLRYLVVRPGLHRRAPLLVLAGLPLAFAALEPRVELGLLAAAGAVLAARAGWLRKALLLGVLGGALAAAWNHGFVAQLVLLHVHNLIALGLWWFWRKRSRAAWLIPLLCAAGTIAIFAGAAEPVLNLTGGWSGPATGNTFGEEVETYAPLQTPGLALRLLLAFVFLQAVHYLVWLRLVPEDDRARPAPRTFTASWNALRSDFGLLPLLGVGAAALLVALWGAFDLAAARDGYLRLAGFHGYLELAVGALWLAEGRR